MLIIPTVHNIPSVQVTIFLDFLTGQSATVQCTLPRIKSGLLSRLGTRPPSLWLNNFPSPVLRHLARYGHLRRASFPMSNIAGTVALRGGSKERHFFNVL